MRSEQIEDRLTNDGFSRTAIIGSWLTALSGTPLFSVYYGLFFILFLLIAGCESTAHRAPVIDRAAVESQETSDRTDAVSEVARERPAFHTVQKGDTLYSIARSYGIDQKELAGWNSIQDTGAIHIGQQINLSSPSQLTKPSLFPVPEPARPSTALAAAPDTAPFPEGKQVVSTEKLKVEPKAFKLPYSELAIAQLKGLTGAPPIVVAKADAMTDRNIDSEISPIPPSQSEAIDGDDRIEWNWPTKGKVLEGFTEATKGIDIAGKPGQPVTASAAGKVVYSWAGLRGYGKLIIIKHNNTYLSAYAHNNKLLVKEGQTVARGQQIAEMGNTDTHLVKLHFEIRKNGKPVDPLKHLPGISG